MIPRWTGEAVKRMHLNDINIYELAQHMGLSREYVSGILNGRVTPAGARKRVLAAIDEIVEERGKNEAAKA